MQAQDAGPRRRRAADATIGEAPPPPPCGTQPITIARMSWPSAALLAEIHARLLTANLSAATCRCRTGDLAATGSSMGATGQPAVAPEMWIARIADIWNAAIKAQKVRPGRRRPMPRRGVRGLVRARLCRGAVAGSDDDRRAQGACRRFRRWRRQGAGSSPARSTGAARWSTATCCAPMGSTSVVDIVEPANRFETRYADRRGGGPEGADPVLLLAAQCGAGAVRASSR